MEGQRVLATLNRPKLCPCCRKETKSPPIEVFAIKNFVHEVDLASRYYQNEKAKGLKKKGETVGMVFDRSVDQSFNDRKEELKSWEREAEAKDEAEEGWIWKGELFKVD